MRWTIAAGLFLLTLFVGAVTPTFAQASGEVQSLGYNGDFRPDCWVPMVVRIRPDTPETGNYQIRVYQHDLDGDRAIYVRPITLNGNTTSADQLFWMYFLPEPIHGGLRDSIADLKRDLLVFLCDAKGKQLVQLPLTSNLSNVDPRVGSGGAISGLAPKGRKLILAVSGNGSQQAPMTKLALSQQGGVPQTVGLTQDVEVVYLRVRDLPENPLGYDAVDAVLWLDGDPADLDAGGAHGLNALRDYVRFGGQLVVTQSTAGWQQSASFGDLLPVDVTGVASKSTFEPLRSLAVAPDVSPQLVDSNNNVSVVAGGANAVDEWTHDQGPFAFARATPRAGAVVDDWIDWKQDGSYADASPYLARRAVGLGQVTWVAQSLTTDAQPTNVNGWPYVWAHVFGWRSDAFVTRQLPVNLQSADDAAVAIRNLRYRPEGGVDLGFALVGGNALALTGKAAGLIAVAIGFFVVYWLVAGPGTFGYLAVKKKQALSWFLFALVALVATAVTVGVVKLMLGGDPTLKHVSVVRVAPDQPAIVFSRFGLYIPHDGNQPIALADTTDGQLSYLSALAEHPQQLGDVSEFPAPLDYEVPVREPTASERPLLTVPYRSSMKKFQARWVGKLPAKISTGGLTLAPESGRLPLKGVLTNDTGRDLADIYLAFHLTGDRDWVVYVPDWKKGDSYGLQRDLVKASFVVNRSNESPRYAHPGEGKVISDELVPRAYRIDASQNGWANFWFAGFRHNANAMDDVERDAGLGTAFPMLSLLDRLPPMPDMHKQNGAPDDFAGERVDFLTRGGRCLGAGASLEAGQLLILATAKGPIPIPLEVRGDRMGGDGTTLYQFLLPIDRGTADKPTTRPIEK